MTVYYECDRRACEVCNPKCHLTGDPRHAANFEIICGKLVEKPRHPLNQTSKEDRE